MGVPSVPIIGFSPRQHGAILEADQEEFETVIVLGGLGRRIVGRAPGQGEPLRGRHGFLDHTRRAVALAAYQAVMADGATRAELGSGRPAREREERDAGGEEGEYVAHAP